MATYDIFSRVASVQAWFGICSISGPHRPVYVNIPIPFRSCFSMYAFVRPRRRPQKLSSALTFPGRARTRRTTGEVAYPGVLARPG